MRTKLLTSLVVGALALGNAGCIKSILLNGQIASTRIGSGAADTIGDYDLARAAASAGMLQFEGMHRLAPDNEDALFMLMRGWAGYGYAFAMDDYEAATLAEDDAAADYHKKRAKLALDRSISYGLELIGHKTDGFKEASDKDIDTINAWLKKSFTEKEDAENLFWVGSAWLARVNLLREDRAYISKLFVGVALLERSRELNPEYMAWGATATLGAYHARAPSAELDDAKKLLDLALEKTQRKALGIQLNYAKYACAKRDRDLYEKMLNEVINTEDPDPNLRLQNAVAKRRATRALTKVAMEDCAFPPVASAPKAAPTPPAPAPAPAPPPAVAPAAKPPAATAPAPKP